LVVEGCFRLVVASGDRKITTRYLRTGDVAGLLSRVLAIHPGENSFTTEWHAAEATALTTVLLLPWSPIERSARTDPSVSWLLTTQLAQIASALNRTMTMHAFDSVKQRVASHILSMAVRDDAGDLVVRASYEVIAGAVGSVREVVARIVRELLEEGCVHRHGRTLVVLEPQLLSARAARELTMSAR
jgi:CRP/FNR family transcriptional regulator